MDPHEARLAFVTTVLFIKAAFYGQHLQSRNMDEMWFDSSSRNIERFDNAVRSIVKHGSDPLAFGSAARKDAVVEGLEAYSTMHGFWVKSPSEVGLDPFAKYARFLGKEGPFYGALFVYVRGFIDAGFPGQLQKIRLPRGDPRLLDAPTEDELHDELHAVYSRRVDEYLAKHGRWADTSGIMRELFLMPF